jgi:hypothetical protein
MEMEYFTEVDVHSIRGYLHRVNVGDVADVSDVHTASISLRA